MPSCSSCKVSEMRHLITIEQRTLTSDGRGGSEETWATFATAYAKITPKSAKEIWQSDKLDHRITHSLLMRYVSGVTADMRISFDSRIFHIKGIRDLEERKRFHEIDAEEGAPA